jgi:hypothetical protein
VRDGVMGFAVVRQVAAAGLVLCFWAPGALAQEKGLSCVAELKKEYGSSTALSPTCPGDYDCTFMAATGNASARALVGTIAEKAESCFTAAGLSVSKEEKEGPGTTRYFSEAGQERCALLIAEPSGSPPEGVRAVCKTE